MASTNILSVFVRGVVVDFQRRPDDSVFLAVRAEKKQKVFWLRLLKFVADLLYKVADYLHPRQYHAPGLEIIQPGEAIPSADCLVQVKYITKLQPCFAQNGDAYYETSIASEGNVNSEEKFFLAGAKVSILREVRQ